jgi:hypothetical protein
MRIYRTRPAQPDLRTATVLLYRVPFLESRTTGSSSYAVQLRVASPGRDFSAT